MCHAIGTFHVVRTSLGVVAVFERGESMGDKPGGNAPEGSRRILVAEDNKTTAESAAKLLALLGNEVLVAHNGPQAIALALSWRPEFILLDIGLPAIDGYAVAAHLRHEEVCQDTIIIAVTGYGQEDDRRRSHEAGIDHHLLKPVSSDVLLPLLSRAVTSSCAGD
jgi:CheY-like chemotaxis protein